MEKKNIAPRAKRVVNVVNATKSVNKAEEVKKITLAMLIAKEVAKNMNKVKSEDKLLHHDICVKLQNLSETSGFPIGVLVYIAVGTSAHKPSIFEKGYTQFNEEKAKRVIALCKAFAKHVGGVSACNDKLVHTICRYDDLFENKGKTKFFKECVADLPTDGFKYTQFKTAKELGKFIFGENLSYNDKGYFIA